MAGVQKHPSVAPDPRSTGLLSPSGCGMPLDTPIVSRLCTRRRLRPRVFCSLPERTTGYGAIAMPSKLWNPPIRTSTVTRAWNAARLPPRACMALGDFSEAARYLGDLGAAQVAGCSERLQFEAAYIDKIEHRPSGPSIAFGLERIGLIAVRAPVLSCIILVVLIIGAPLRHPAYQDRRFAQPALPLQLEGLPAI